MILIPFATTLVYYFVVLDGWSQNPKMNIQNIKEVLVRYGNLSEAKSQSFSNSGLDGSNFSYAEEAKELARQDLYAWGLFSG